MADPTECEHGCTSCVWDQLADAIRDLFLELVMPIVERIPWLTPRPWVDEHLRKQQTLTMLVTMGLSGHEARRALWLPPGDMNVFVRAIVLGATTDEAWEAVAQSWRDLTPPGDTDV